MQTGVHQLLQAEAQGQGAPASATASMDDGPPRCFFFDIGAKTGETFAVFHDKFAHFEHMWSVDDMTENEQNTYQ